jgi:hypothetical protein
MITFLSFDSFIFWGKWLHQNYLEKHKECKELDDFSKQVYEKKLWMHNMNSIDEESIQLGLIGSYWIEA